MLQLLLRLQGNADFLEALKDACMSKADADSLTIEEIMMAAAIAHAQESDPKAAESFCFTVWRLISYGESPACDRISSAGAIPFMLELLARFLDEQQVTSFLCAAVYGLVFFGSEAVQAQLLVQSGLDAIALLEAASTRLQAWSKFDFAAEALKMLPVRV